MLQPALAGRPGRIDQAIEIGLPEDRGTRATPNPPLSKRIGKVSPAFIKEIDRRAAQAMLERGGNELGMEDFERALGDRVRSGGKLSARLAGGEAVGFVR